MASNQQHLKTRSVRRGPEWRLLKAAVKSGLPLRVHKAIFLREAFLPSGVPDLIAVEAQAYPRDPRVKRRRLEICHLQMLHFLNERGPTIEAEVRRLLNLSEKESCKMLEQLSAASLVVRKRDVVSIRPSANLFTVRRIVAIEAKMQAWRTALQQATANLWFASHSYILVPAMKCLRRIADEARTMGIGVLVFDGKRTRTLVRPRKHPIPASYGSWLINEWAVHKSR